MTNALADVLAEASGWFVVSFGRSCVVAFVTLPGLCRVLRAAHMRMQLRAVSIQ